MINYKDEFYVRAYRCWIIISTLENANVSVDSLDIEKCSFIDYLISHPSMLKRCLDRFNKGLSFSKVPETLYPTNIEFGNSQNKDNFTKSAIYLKDRGYINIEIVDGKFLLSTSSLTFPTDSELVKTWEHYLLLLKPLLSKSVSILQKSILSEVPNE